MRIRTVITPILALGLMAAPAAFAQNRFMDQAKEDAARRAENKQVRELEHPEDSAKPAAPAPAPAPVTTAAAPAAPADPAPAAPATADAAPAPATPAAPAH